MLKRSSIRRFSLGLLVFSALALLSGRADAGATLALDYAVTPVAGNLFQYDFTLKVDESTGAFAPGQGWGWIIFGDARLSTSPLEDFVGDTSSFVGGPWNGFALSSGFHNGPSLLPPLTVWAPTSVGETVKWSGRSSFDLPQGQLLFSSLVRTGGAVRPDFAVATRLSAVPEPSTLLLGGLAGLGTLIFARRVRKA